MFSGKAVNFTKHNLPHRQYNNTALLGIYNAKHNKGQILFSLFTSVLYVLCTDQVLSGKFLLAQVLLCGTQKILVGSSGPIGGHI